MIKAINGSALNFKGANSILFGGILLLTCGVFLTSESIRAQMANLYSESSDQVAGINSLMSAAANNDLAGIKFFSKAGAALVNQKNFGGATALHIAAREKNLEIAKVLVENGADVNAIDNEGWTPLMRASLAGDAALVTFLLEKNADASGVNSANESAIMQATQSDCDKCLAVMFEKFNFIKMMDTKLLTQQITDSYSVARNHENDVVQKLLGDYLERSTKMANLSGGEDGVSEPVPTQVMNITATPPSSASQKSLLKKFKFTGSSSGTISSIEKAEPVSIQKKELANITSVPVKEQSLNDPKVSYKFISGQSKAERGNKVMSLIQAGQKARAATVTAPTTTGNRVFKFKKMEPAEEPAAAVAKPQAVEEVKSLNDISSSNGAFKFKQGEGAKEVKKVEAAKPKIASPKTLDLEVAVPASEVAN